MSSGTGVLRIGEVHAQLRREFPDIELSKIRYYEEKGLVQPSRSRKGYRLYSDRDVACLREAIRLAQEEFVPLKVVRLRLIEKGLLRENSLNDLTTSPRRAAREVSSAAVSMPVPSPSRPALHVVEGDDMVEPHDAPVRELFSAQEILSMTGLSPDAFNQLLATGLIEPFRLEGETLYRAIDLRVCAQARALLERGVDVRLLGALRRVVEREVGIIDDLTASLRNPGSSLTAEQSQVICREVASEVGALRSVLSERAVSDYFDA
ncbi:MAG TPA: MerR family transcriptional regulator [Acidimicrobiales bacterium]|nr:MerR family transcriptional regulator [Acidimicrobiales bacterium]